MDSEDQQVAEGPEEVGEIEVVHTEEPNINSSELSFSSVAVPYSSPSSQSPISFYINSAVPPPDLRSGAECHMSRDCPQGVGGGGYRGVGNGYEGGRGGYGGGRDERGGRGCFQC